MALEQKGRISILDGFRCIAILMVLLEHYACTYTFPILDINLYPYGDRYVYLYKNGYLGVQLFFIISGFVIFMTLEKCSSVKEFLIKRFIRLFPLLLLASIVTFSFPFIFDSNNQYPLFHRPIIDFLPSLTFTDIWFWNQLFHKKLDYVDGAYWTLAAEAKFYIFGSIIFFLNQRKFIENWTIFTIFLMISYILSIKLHIYSIEKILEYGFISKHIIFFTLGIYFYDLSKKQVVNKPITALIFLLVILQMAFLLTFNERVFVCIFISLFLLFIYKPNWLSFLSFPVITTIGLVSYPLYLTHQNMGVILIGKLAFIFNLSSFSGILIPLMIIFFIIISYFLHNFLERPISGVLKKWLLAKGR